MLRWAVSFFLLLFACRLIATAPPLLSIHQQLQANENWREAVRNPRKAGVFFADWSNTTSLPKSPQTTLTFINGLGDSNFTIRNKNQNALIQQGYQGLEALEIAAAEHKDAEIRSRARGIVHGFYVGLGGGRKIRFQIFTSYLRLLDIQQMPPLI